MFLIGIRQFLAKKTSISFQLTVFYSLATFLLVAVICLFFYLGMVHILYNADRQFLSDEINIIQNILKTRPNSLVSLNQEITDIPNTLKNSVYHYYIRILNENHKIVLATPKIEDINNQDIKVLANEDNLWLPLNVSNRFLEMSSTTSVGNHQILSIQVILDVSYQNAVINHYRKNALFVLLIGAIFSILIGILITRRGLSRLHELTNITKKITARTLQQRVEPELWPIELQELAEAYNQMLDRLENAITRLTSFSDELAHELRSPITNLMVATELTLTQHCSTEDYQTVMESNLEELNRLYQIIENILFLAQAENPQPTIQKDLLNIHDEINVMCRFYQAIADEKNIHISCEGKATVIANSTMFRRMIGNILSNALKFSFVGSEVKFDIKEMSDHTIQITLTDTGIGIAEEHLPKIFDRFYRADTARSQNVTGYGLGLAIVKSIVKLHHGTLVVKSGINKGTKVIINLPK